MKTIKLVEQFILQKYFIAFLVEEKLIVKTWNLYNHSAAIFLIFLLSFGSGLLLKQYTSAALPFLDALTSWGAIITTYMVAKKLLENWIYWFVIDTISIYLYNLSWEYLSIINTIDPSQSWCHIFTSFVF